MLASLLIALALFSTTFHRDAAVPLSMVAKPCGGENRSPALQWSGVPNGTRSFALVVHDPDAPLPGGFVHWVLYDIPASTRSLAANRALAGSQSGRNGTGSTGYFGPCPPPGKVHHYNFTLYALDVPTIAAAHPLTAGELVARVARHILATARLTGLYARH